MFHWDLPQALGNRGGIEADQFPTWFTEYARVLFKEYGSSVKYWFTHNEPINMCGDDGIESYKCAHNLIKAHGLVYRMYEKEFKSQQQGTVAFIFAVSFKVLYSLEVGKKIVLF